MALLIATGQTDWIPDEDLRDELRALSADIAPELAADMDIRTEADPGPLHKVTMVAVSRLPAELPARLPNLQLVQKLGAGVETIVAHPALPDHVRVTRLKPEAPAHEIAEYCLAYILRGQRNMAAHAQAQVRQAWEPIAPRRAPETTVGVLGLGHIGGRTAVMLRDHGFRVVGWSRSARAIEGVDCRHGPESLGDVLGTCDYVAAILPSTVETRSMINAQTLARFKPGATFLNAGRGDLVDETALLAALDSDRLAEAVLDVVSAEPLPSDSPLWSHPRVTVTPHVSGWHLGDAMRDVVENYRRLTAGAPLLHEVDRERGY